jgi:hypothetical protein
MLHKDRVWQVFDEEISSDDIVAGHLTTLYALCVGFLYRGYLYLNDSASMDHENGYVEWAVVRDDDLVQVDSVMFKGDKEAALAYIQRLGEGNPLEPSFTGEKVPFEHLQTPLQHGDCPLCY